MEYYSLIPLNLMFKSFWNKHGEKIKSISKGAAIAGIGAILSYAIPYLAAVNIPEQYVPLWVAGLGILVNIIRKFGVPIAETIILGSKL